MTFDRRDILRATALGGAGWLAGCTAGPLAPKRAPLLAFPGELPRLGTTPASASDPLMDDIQRRTVSYFWNTTDQVTGLAPDRWPTPSFASIAAVGFALTTYPIAATRGWITRAAAAQRTLATLRFFANAPQGPDKEGMTGYKGFFYHFLGVTKGHRFARTELSTIDTALLLGGVLFAQTWFDDEADPAEREIRALADQLYRAVEWDWITPRKPFVSMGWHPESGFIGSDWNIYNESLILYVLALGSPTHALPPTTWDAWTAKFDPSWDEKYDNPFTAFPPLFGHQYSQVWIDFRGLMDTYSKRRGFDYFENSRRATYAQRRYAINNPAGWRGYGENVWGLTACDGPGDFVREINGRKREFFSYSARGPGDRDDGTIAPTAALGSVAFAPEIVLPAARAMYSTYGTAIYDRYGFRDSFNPTLTLTDVKLQHGKVVPYIGWVADDFLGIDQGPIACMIENWRSGLIWKTMQKNPYIRAGLERAGFKGGWLSPA